MTPEDMMAEWNEKAEICLKALLRMQMMPNTVENARRAEVLRQLYTSLTQFHDALDFSRSLPTYEFSLASMEVEQK